MLELMDIKGDVRGDGQYHSLKDFVQPYDPLVMEIASVLTMSEDPVETAQDFVHRVIKYRKQNIEFWDYPAETLRRGEGDCDETAILLCSILRNYLSPEDVYVAVGNINGDGHAWVVANWEIIESTASSGERVNEARYKPEVFFNDRYCYAEPNGFGFIMIGKHNFQVGR